MGWVFRRSLPSVGALLGLVLAVGVAAVLFLDAPPWFPAVFAIAIIGLQYAINPFIVQWLIPAQVIGHDGTRYFTDHPIGELLARRCRDAGIPLVTLGIVDDGTPNAFTFGRVRRDARIWISRGVFERLDEREIDAVVTHEVGHVRHYDFILMTIAAVVPMVLYLVYVTTRVNNNAQARAVAVGAYVAYLLSKFSLLALSRSREYAADHWSCECTGDGDALASALVKIAYGIGQIDAERRARIEALQHQGKQGKREAAKLARQAQRAQSLHAMGIFDPTQAEAMAVAVASGVDPQRATAAMRYEIVSPWPAVLEKLSTHPIVSRRIRALEQSGLPGAPRTWSVLRQAAGDVSEAERQQATNRFTFQLTIAVAPWALGVVGVLLVVAGVGLGAALVAGSGLAFLLKQAVRYPTKFERVDRITSLLDRLDASPVAGIPVEIDGWITGRGVPGYVLSPDLVVADESGFVPVRYNSSLPFANSLFGLARARTHLNQYAIVRGWYLRSPGPALELREIRSSHDRSVGIEWITRWIASAAVVVIGVALTLAML